MPKIRLDQKGTPLEELQTFATQSQSQSIQSLRPTGNSPPRKATVTAIHAHGATGYHESMIDQFTAVY
jgi:hypothetical protein